MSAVGFSGQASADIRTSRFVKVSGEFTIAECDANEDIFGISQQGTNEAPIPGVTSDLAASTGQSCRVHKPGERCFIRSGDAITAGNRLKSDNDGRGVPIATSGTTPQRYGAKALQDAAAADELVEVEVVLGVESPA